MKVSFLIDTAGQNRHFTDSV